MRLLPGGQAATSDVELADTCEFVAEQVDRATVALLEPDPVVAQRVLDAETPALRLADWQESAILALAGRRRPLTRDLRVAIASARAATELERMDDLARHVAKIVVRHRGGPVLPKLLRQRFADMGDIARSMTISASCVLYYGDQSYVDAVVAAEADMDELHRSLFPVLSTAGWREERVNQVDASLLSQFYEQYADHAVLLAAQFAVCVDPGSR